MSRLFTPLTMREVTFRNRIFMSPMCQYSSQDGMPNDWHLVHLGSRAAGGVGLVIVEASAVAPEGRITPWDSGMWTEEQAAAYKRITDFIKGQGAVAGIQLAHAGRKASTDAPWRGGGALSPEAGGWEVAGPSPIPFNAASPTPRELSAGEIDALVEQFVASAGLAERAGFEMIELHMAHGYLLHEFLSPLTNQRKDPYGGSLENRMRLPLRVARAVRQAWPAERPLFVRISATDWVESGGWDLEQSVALARELKALGVDLIDCSSGGLIPHVCIPVAPGYQTSFAWDIRRRVGIATGAVGLITSAEQAEGILERGQADAVLLARELLRRPHWALHAARKLGEAAAPWPAQYERARD